MAIVALILKISSFMIMWITFIFILPFYYFKRKITPMSKDCVYRLKKPLLSKIASVYRILTCVALIFYIVATELVRRFELYWYTHISYILTILYFVFVATCDIETYVETTFVNFPYFKKLNVIRVLYVLALEGSIASAIGYWGFLKENAYNGSMWKIFWYGGYPHGLSLTLLLVDVFVFNSIPISFATVFYSVVFNTIYIVFHLLFHHFNDVWVYPFLNPFTSVGHYVSILLPLMPYTTHSAVWLLSLLRDIMIDRLYVPSESTSSSSCYFSSSSSSSFTVCPHSSSNQNDSTAAVGTRTGGSLQLQMNMNMNISHAQFQPPAQMQMQELAGVADWLHMHTHTHTHRRRNSTGSISSIGLATATAAAATAAAAAAAANGMWTKGRSVVGRAVTSMSSVFGGPGTASRACAGMDACTDASGASTRENEGEGEGKGMDGGRGSGGLGSGHGGAKDGADGGDRKSVV